MARSKFRVGSRGAVYKKRISSARGRSGWGNGAIYVAPARTRKSLNYRTGGFLGIEKKYFDTGIIPTNMVVSSTIASCVMDSSVASCCNSPAVGDGPNQREGRQIAMDRIDVKGFIRMDGDATYNNVTTTPHVEVYLVLDTQTNGAQMASEECFVNTIASTPNGGLPFRNLENEKRFRILASKKIEMPSQPIAYNATTAKSYRDGHDYGFTLSKNLKGMKVNFKATGAAGTVATITDNSIHFIAVLTDNSSLVKCAWNARLRFRG